MKSVRGPMFDPSWPVRSSLAEDHVGYVPKAPKLSDWGMEGPGC